MDELITESSLIDIDLSSPPEESLTLHDNLTGTQPENWNPATYQHLTNFASEECFDRILDHLRLTFEAFQGPSPTTRYTRKTLDSTTLFTICRVLHHAYIHNANAGLDALLEPSATTGYVDSESSLDPKILPLVLRSLRPWRLEDPWIRYDGTFRDSDATLAKLDAVELATSLAALANNPRTDAEEIPIQSGHVRLRIKWLGRVDSDDAAVGPLYEDAAPCDATPSIEPEAKNDESYVRLPELEASLFRSGCLACRLPRQTPCFEMCRGVHQRNQSTTNMRPVNAETESKRPRPTPHPIFSQSRKKEQVHARSITYESVTTKSKPIPNIRSAPKGSRENDAKENIPPTIQQRRLLLQQQDSSADGDMTISSDRATPPQAQITVSSAPTRPVLFSNLSSHDQIQSNITSFPPSGVVRSTARPTTKPNSQASALRPSGSSHSTSRSIPGKEQRDMKPVTQQNRSRSLQRTRNTGHLDPYHPQKAAKDKNAAQGASSLGPAVPLRILGQRNR